MVYQTKKVINLLKNDKKYFEKYFNASIKEIDANRRFIYFSNKTRMFIGRSSFEDLNNNVISTSVLFTYINRIKTIENILW